MLTALVAKQSYPSIFRGLLQGGFTPLNLQKPLEAGMFLYLFNTTH